VTIQLRDYQLRLIDEAREAMRVGTRSLILQSPTGSGKTALTAAMLHAAAAKGTRAWFLVHRAELVQQSEAAFRLAGVRHGIIAAGYGEDPNAPVQICSVQTLVRRLGRFPKPDMIVTDECQHAVAGTWNKIIAHVPKAYHIGLTATPVRLDGKGLSLHFQKIILGPTVNDLIARGFLADYEVYAPQLADTAGLHTRAGDYAKDEVAALMEKPTITGDAISHYKRLAFGKRAIVFASSIKHSRQIAAQFLEHRIPAAHVDGETERDERLRIMRAFREGTIRVVSNVDLFGEGVDVPSIEAAILLRPTKSLGLYLQQVGRALRPSEGKTHAIIIDHVGAVRYHGLPDEPHEWTLDGVDRERQKKDSVVGVKICPDCFRAVRAVVKVCPCGHSFVPKERKLAHVDGELQKVDKEAARRKARMEQGMADDLDELTALGVARYGLKKGPVWARIVHSARKAKLGR